MAQVLGEMDLPFSQVGSIVQAFSRALVDRGYDEDTVREHLIQWADEGNEPLWWENVGGEVLDGLEEELMLIHDPRCPYSGAEDTAVGEVGCICAALRAR